jgi:hypothetical protein
MLSLVLELRKGFGMVPPGVVLGAILFDLDGGKGWEFFKS